MPPSNAVASPPPPWFQGAPLTKLSCMFWVINYVVFQHKSKPFQILFDSTGELVIGLAFLGQLFRKLERELGSRKFLVWLVWIGLVQAALLASNIIETVAAQGPFAYMGAALWYYARYVPRLHPRFISILGIQASEKAVWFLTGLYLLASQGRPSFLLGCLGAAASAAYFVTGWKKYVDIPELLVQNLPWDSLGALLFLDPPPKVYAPLLVAGGRGLARREMAVGGGGGEARRPRRRAAPVERPPQPPPQEAIDQLTAMGFEESAVRAALEASHNNVERAADRLLMGS